MEIRKLVQLLSLTASTVAMASSPVIYLGQGQVASGYTVPASGTYILTDNVTINGPITLGYDDVVFDLNGKTINGGGQNIDAIDVTGLNVTVKNGKIRYIGSANKGIYIEAGADDALVTDIVVQNCGTGIDVNATNASINNCTALSNGTGIEFQAGTSGSVTNSEISYSTSDGIDIDGGTTYVFISSCVANVNGGVGFNAQNTSETSLAIIKNCTAQGNTSWGFQTASNYAQVRGNIGFGNNGTGGAAGSDNNYNLAIGTLAIPGYYPIVNGTQQAPGAVIDPVVDNISFQNPVLS